jgi:hypothetical protein
MGNKVYKESQESPVQTVQFQDHKARKVNQEMIVLR